MKGKEAKKKNYLSEKYSMNPYINYSISRINSILFPKSHLNLCYKEMTLNLPYKEIINDYANISIWNIHRMTVNTIKVQKYFPFYIDDKIEEIMLSNKKSKDELNRTKIRKESEIKNETFFTKEQMKILQTPKKDSVNESIKEITNLIYEIDKECTHKKKEDVIIKCENKVKQSTKKKKKIISLNNENINISNFNIKRISTCTQFESNITKTKSFKSTKSFIQKERDKKQKITQTKSKIIISLTNKIFLSPKAIHSPLSPNRNFFYIPPTNQKISYQNNQKKPQIHQSKHSSFNHNRKLSLINNNRTFKLSSITSLPYIKL